MFSIKFVRQALALCGVALTTSAAWAADPSEEAKNQVSNLLGSAINSRIADKLQQGDTNKNLVWGGLTHMNLQAKAGDGDDAFKISSNLGIVGYDREIAKDLIVGASVNSFNLVHGNSLDFFDSNYRAHGFSMYGAYIINDTFFVVADYSRIDWKVNDDAGGYLKLGVNTYGLSLNAQKKVDNFNFRGRVGANHTEAMMRTVERSPASDNTSWMYAEGYVADGQVSYNFTPSTFGYVGVMYGTAFKEHTDTALARIGVETKLTKDLTLTGKYERLVHDNLQVDGLKIDSYNISARLSF